MDPASRKLVRATLICSVFICGEFLGGYLAGSLAIMTEAAHLLSHVVGFLVSLFCIYLANHSAKKRDVLTFGYKRAEVMGALLSVLTIWMVTFLIIQEGIYRTVAIINDQAAPVDGEIMFIVAVLGLICNLILMKVLASGHSHFGQVGSHGHTHGTEVLDAILPSMFGGGHGHAHDGEGDHGHSHEGGAHGHSHGDSRERNKPIDPNFQQSHKLAHGHSHDLEHGHSHEQAQDHGHSHDQEHGHSHDQGQDHGHSHEQAQDHGHSHDGGDHGHSHAAPAPTRKLMHSHSHSHDGNRHSHSHGGHVHLTSRGMTKRAVPKRSKQSATAAPASRVASLDVESATSQEREIEKEFSEVPLDSQTYPTLESETLPIPSGQKQEEEQHQHEQSQQHQEQQQQSQQQQPGDLFSSASNIIDDIVTRVHEANVIPETVYVVAHEVTENINIAAAYVHALGDVFQSLGIILAGTLIWAYPAATYPNVQLADPIVTFIFSIPVLLTTVPVIRSSFHVLMEGVPEHIKSLEIRNGLKQLEGVKRVHDLHIWSLSLDDPFLSVHLLIELKSGGDVRASINQTLIRAQHYLRSRGIKHSTIQIELARTRKCDNLYCDDPECSGYAEPCDEVDCHAIPMSVN